MFKLFFLINFNQLKIKFFKVTFYQLFFNDPKTLPNI